MIPWGGKLRTELELMSEEHTHTHTNGKPKARRDHELGTPRHLDRGTGRVCGQAMGFMTRILRLASSDTCKVQVTYVIRGSILVSWESILYPRSIFLKSYDMRRTFSRLIRECGVDFITSLTLKWQLLYVSLRVCFCCMRWYAGTQHPCITRITFTRNTEA